jgi:hypothetical protein
MDIKDIKDIKDSSGNDIGDEGALALSLSFSIMSMMTMNDSTLLLLFFKHKSIVYNDSFNFMHAKY